MLYCSSLVRTRLGSLGMAVGADYSVSGEKKWQSIRPGGLATYVLLLSDVAAYFPDEQSVNAALRTLIPAAKRPLRRAPSECSAGLGPGLWGLPRFLRGEPGISQ